MSILLFLSLQCAVGQDLIPNGSFEDIIQIPEKWNTSGSDFSGILSHWSSPTQASPDVYGPDIHIPNFWAKKGFGFITAHDGKGFVGLTVYGCTEGKPHCREYVQVKMSELLVPGQQYELSFWLSPMSKGLRANNIGVAFSYDSVQSKLDKKINLLPAANIQQIVASKPGNWVQAKLLFQAKAREAYLILGNFYEDKETRIKSDPIFTKYKFAYYYIDDVRMKKIPPIIEYIDTSNVYLERSFEIDERVVLENVYFDYDQSTLLPKSYLTLAHLLELLNEYPAIKIELVGHTDSDGTDRYNVDLSRRRAKTVYEYLIEKNIDQNRLQFSGEGEQAPIATNETEKGKALNRRVEFRIVEQ